MQGLISIMQAELILPLELYHAISSPVFAKLGDTHYLRVVLKPEQLLELQFFERYIKKGMDRTGCHDVFFT